MGLNSIIITFYRTEKAMSKEELQKHLGCFDWAGYLTIKFSILFFFAG